jgi:hypothetical protein
MAENEDIKKENQIIDAIKSGNTKMRPHWYFVVRAILMVIALILTLFLVVYTISFIIFALQQNGGIMATSFGLLGWGVFFRAIPWSVLLLSLALILILLVLLRQYSFINHQPSLYILLLLIVVIALSTFFIAASNFHRRIEENDIPVIGEVYQYETSPENYIYQGRIVQLISGGFVLQNAIGQTSTFIVAPSTTLDLSLFTIGTFVKIFGQLDPRASATIDMYGIQSGQ